jgi:hypothetical protein
VLYPYLTNTSYLVQNLTLSLPRRFLIIYLNNYFTSITLFLELQAYNFNAIKTTRLYKEFLKELLNIKNRFAIKLKWNTLLIIVVQDTLYLA